MGPAAESRGQGRWVRLLLSLAFTRTLLSPGEGAWLHVPCTARSPATSQVGSVHNGCPPEGPCPAGRRGLTSCCLPPPADAAAGGADPSRPAVHGGRGQLLCYRREAPAGVPAAPEPQPAPGVTPGGPRPLWVLSGPQPPPTSQGLLWCYGEKPRTREAISQLRTLAVAGGWGEAGELGRCKAHRHATALGCM